MLGRLRHINRSWAKIVPESVRLGGRYWRLGRELSPYVLGRRDRWELMRFCAAVPWANRQPGRSPRPATFQLADGPRVCIGARSELLAMREIFSLDEYAMDLPFEPAVILDCGANVGFASLYFASRYPSARIYALEPDPGTFRRLEANTRDADNVVALARALAAKDGAVPFFSSPASVSSSLTRRSSDQREISVDAVSLGSLMGSLGLAGVDVLKLDIEGAEFSVLENAGEALRAVGVVIAEIHYDLGERDEGWLRNLLADFDCVLTPGRSSGRQLLKALRRGLS